MTIDTNLISGFKWGVAVGFWGGFILGGGLGVLGIFLDHKRKLKNVPK